MALSILGTLVIWAKRKVCLFHLISAWCSFIVYMKAYYIIRSQFQIKMVKKYSRWRRSLGDKISVSKRQNQ